MTARRRCEPVGIAASRCETDAVSGAKVGDCAVALGIGGAVMTSERRKRRVLEATLAAKKLFRYP